MRSASTRALAAMVLLCAATVVPCLSAEPETGLEAITRPSDKRTLSFVRPGLIMELNVKKGDKVTMKQIVALQDDREEQQMLAASKEESEDETEIDAEKAVQAADKAEYERKRDTRGVGASEVREAELKVTVDEARIKLAIFKKKQAAYKYAQNKAIVEKLKLVTPIEGLVSETYMKAGEATDGQNMKVLDVVQIDPLWVEVPVPILQARKLNDGDAASVRFSDGKSRTGKIVLKSVVADPAAGTITMRVAVPNPEKLEPGEPVRVTFPQAAVAGAAPAGR